VASKIQKILSYIKDLSLEETFSEFNPHLEVLLVNGRHQLITKDAIYSYDDKYDNFYESFKKINWNKFKPQKVLVLGLGLGSVIYILEKKFKLLFDYTAVEIDSEIVRMAHKYTLRDLKSYVEVMLVDAENYLNITSENYDLILMDIFQSAKIPARFESEDFIEQLKSRLNQDGLLFYNRMNANESDKESNVIFDSNFNHIFPNCRSIPIKDNLMYVSDKKYLQ
jgi:spermidine synthase